MRMSTSIFVATSDQDRLYRRDIKLNIFDSNEKTSAVKCIFPKIHLKIVDPSKAKKDNLNPFFYSQNKSLIYCTRTSFSICVNCFHYFHLDSVKPMKDKDIVFLEEKKVVIFCKSQECHLLGH